MFLEGKALKIGKTNDFFKSLHKKSPIILRGMCRFCDLMKKQHLEAQRL